MTDDQIWERASIGERVELLRRRLDIVPECIVDTVKAVHAAAAPPTPERIERWKRIEKAALGIVPLIVDKTRLESERCFDLVQELLDALKR